jgi:hypothetical protein
MVLSYSFAALLGFAYGRLHVRLVEAKAGLVSTFKC